MRLLYDTRRRDATVTVSAVLATACVGTTPPARAVSPLAPADAYTCLVRAAAQRDYSVASGDRGAGFLQLEKRHGGLVGTYWTEVLVTILPDTAGAGSQLQLQVQRSAEEGGRRRTAGMTTTRGDAADAAAIRAACSGGGA